MYHWIMTNFDKSLFVSKLRERYDTLGLIPEDLEKFAGDTIPLKTLKNYFNNKFRKTPTISTILSLCDLLQTNPEFLLGISDNPSPSISPEYDWNTLIEKMRTRYREINLLPMDLELYAKSIGIKFDTMRDMLNNELPGDAGIDILMGFSTLLKSTISELLELKPALKQENKAVPLFESSKKKIKKISKKKKTRGDGVKIALYMGLIGAGLIIAGSFAPAVYNNDNSTIILFKHPAGITLAVLGFISLIFLSLEKYRMLRLPAIGNLIAAGWAFVAIQSSLKPGQLMGDWIWLLIGAGTFVLLLATILKTDK